jgi:ketosteroid isomerase-like protein
MPWIVDGSVRARTETATHAKRGASMTAEDNKQVVSILFDRLTAGDIDGVLELLTDDVVWRVPGKPELSPVAGDYDKARLRRLFLRMLRQLKDGLKMTVVSAIAERDQVAVEVESKGDLQNGREYRQQYHFRIGFRDGKIASVHEYLDTHHAYDVWIRP